MFHFIIARCRIKLKEKRLTEKYFLKRPLQIKDTIKKKMKDGHKMIK